jgi:hypothetical protein
MTGFTDSTVAWPWLREGIKVVHRAMEVAEEEAAALAVL